MWQTKLGHCIYTSPSGYKVYQNFFYRWLTLGNPLLQTVIKRKAPQEPVLYYLPALTLMARTLPGSCCLLGLGGAAVAHYIHPLKCKLVAVESEKEIITIAQRFFAINDLDNLTIIHQEAGDFMKNCTTHYDHLLIDIHHASSFPEHCMTEDFFLSCALQLKEDGFLAVNLALSQQHFTIFRLIKTYFKHTLVIPIKGCSNLVIIASNHQDHHVFFNSLEQSKEFKHINLIGSWGCVGQLASKGRKDTQIREKNRGINQDSVRTPL